MSFSRSRRRLVAAVVAVNLIVLAAFAAAASALSDRGRSEVAEAVTGRFAAPRLAISHDKPLRVQPFYDDPGLVSDAALKDVLEKVRPAFEPKHLSPNYVEHALRAWGAAAEFHDPAVMDGPAMVEFLTDHGRWLASWGDKQPPPLLVEEPGGVAIRWGKLEGASVHHDHWLASLTEAGVPLDMPIYGPNRRGDTLNDALQEALRDFNPDERETEWSAMAFGFWLPPDHKAWVNGAGRRIDFNLLADVLMRGDQRFGVCSGTHRVYSLMVLLRLDDRYQLLNSATREEAYGHLRMVRDMITLSQWDDGRWPSNWSDGAAARDRKIDEPVYRQVIATGHHLEWLAIAYPDLHPNRAVVKKAADWIVAQVRETPQATIMENYTFYSHVGNALALWRKTRPAAAWERLQAGLPLETGGE